MKKEIIKDQFILTQTSIPATKEDLPIISDLLDTMHSYNERCVGIAANMIGITKRIIVVKDNNDDLVMVNPEMIKTAGRIYEAEEGCLCHDGTKKTKRFERIKVKYRNQDFQLKIKSFEGMTAQIIQHELDHCEGILI